MNSLNCGHGYGVWNQKEEIPYLGDFDCVCGCKLNNINPILVQGLIDLENKLGTSINILSGCRCKSLVLKFDKEHTGENSCEHAGIMHKQGKASDILFKGFSPKIIYEYAININIFFNGGIGVYSDYIHLDISLSSWPHCQ